MNDVEAADDSRRNVVDYLTRQRWFSGSEDPEQIEVVDTTAFGWLSDPMDGVGVRVELVTVRTPSGDRTYNLPLSYRTEPVESNAYGLIGLEQWDEGEFFVYDALHDNDARAILLGGFFNESVAGLDYVSRVPLDDEGEPEIMADSPSLLLSVDQSNTSVVVDEKALLKVFRRVLPGRNPDIEVHAALSGTGGDSIAEIWGWLSTTGSGDEPGHDLAMLQRFLRTASDGWESARTSVRDLLADPDVQPEEAGGDFAGEAERLGATAAHIHALMADLLPTSTWGREELTALADRLGARLDAVVARAPQLAEHAEAIRAVYAQVGDLDISVRAQRVHGDLHLGQSLRTSVGWKIIDFEGEPSAPLAERSALDATARDLAGMLRSFDYAAHSFVLQSGVDDVAAQADAWVARNHEAFLRGYGFVDSPEQMILLRAYELDKAVYEVGYEVDHRPDWTSIPLRAIETLVHS